MTTNATRTSRHVNAPRASVYRALCRRALMFHHLAPELGTPDCPVRSTEFEYDEGPVASFMTAVGLQSD